MIARAPRSDNLRGSLWMVTAMAGFAVEDMFLKAATAHIPVGQALLIFGLIGAAFFAILTKRAGETLLHPALLSRPPPKRGTTEVRQ